VIGGTTKAPRRETVLALENTLKEGGLAEKYAPMIFKSEGNDSEFASGIREAQLAYNAAAEYEPMKDGTGELKKRGAEYEPVKDEKGRPVKKQGEYTIVDYLNWPSEERIELINGRVYDLAAPSYVHQEISFRIARQIDDYIEKKDGDCNVGIAPLDVQLDEDDRTMVQPDVIIDCRKEKRSKMRIIGAPDFVLEVLSDSSRSKDIIIKTEKYMTAGCKEYWIIDPENETVIVYDFKNERYPLNYTFKDKVPVNIYNGDLSIDFRIIKKKLIKLFGEK
jgi:Uma2 family endonuclease